MLNKEIFSDLHTQAEIALGKNIPVFNSPADGEKTTVGIIGTPQENLLGLILKTVEGGSEFADLLCMHNYQCTVLYGEETSYSFVSENQKLATTAAGLSEALTAYDGSNDIIRFEIMLNAPLLCGLTLKIFASDEFFDDFDSKAVISDCDYVFAALSAIALLSLSERKLLRKSLIPNLQNALGILVLDYEKIPDSEKQHIDSSLESFFKDQFPICYPTEQTSDLQNALMEICEKAESLREQRAAKVLEFNIQTVVAEVRAAIKTFSEDEDYIADAIALLREKAEVLPKKQEAAVRRCRMQYISPMRVEYAGEISGFYQKLTDTLHSEISKSEDFEKTRKLLPGYLKNEWERELLNVADDMKCRGSKIETELTEYIRNDVFDALQDGGNTDMASYIFQLTELYPQPAIPDSQKDLTVEKTNSHPLLKNGGMVAAGIGAGFLVHPLVGAGIAIYSITKGRKDIVFKIQEQTRDALKKAADTTCADYYADAVEFLESVFVQLNETVNKGIEESYNKLMDSMLAAIRARQADADAKEKHIAELRQLEADLLG